MEKFYGTGTDKKNLKDAEKQNRIGVKYWLEKDEEPRKNEEI